MSENAGWSDPIEVKPVAVSPVPTVEAQLARMHDHVRGDRRSPRVDSPFFRRISPRRNAWPEVVAYDERARSLTRRVVTLNRRPIEAALGVTTRLAAGGVFEVLRRDSDYLAQAMPRSQALALGITDP